MWKVEWHMHCFYVFVTVSIPTQHDLMPYDDALHDYASIYFY